MRHAIPTRMSVHDLHFDPEFARRLIISLDDVEQHQVIAYDVDAGLITRYATDDAGQPIAVAGELVTEDKHGEVVVILKPI